MSRAATAAWVKAGAIQSGIGVLLGLATAAPVEALGDFVNVLALAGGLALLATALGSGLAPAWSGRAAPPAWLAWSALAAFVGADLFLASPVGNGFGMPLFAAGLALCALAIGMPFVVGGKEARHVSPLAPGQPYRTGDMAALAGLAVGAAGLLASALLLAFPPRPIPTSGLVTLLLGALAPLLLGALTFLVPRHAREPLSGATLVAGALLMVVLAAAGLAWAYARPVGADFRTPAAVVVLAAALSGVAFLRVPLPGDAGPARPLLRGAFVLGGLAALATFLAYLGNLPGSLVAVALYALLVEGALLAMGALLLGSRLLLPGRVVGAAWAKWATALAIAGLFVLAPHFQYPRSAFPGAVVLTVAAMVALWGARGLLVPARQRAR